MKFTWSIGFGLAVIVVTGMIMKTPSLGSLIGMLIICVLLTAMREAAIVETRRSIKAEAVNRAERIKSWRNL